MEMHVLGICGTFMAGIALLAKELGYQVTGTDQNIYPPMSTLLEHQGISVREGYEVNTSTSYPEMTVMGNSLTRGMPLIEQYLNEKRPLRSGPQWLAEHVLRDRWVIAVAGTHGKTTTTSMIAWILEQLGATPGFLIGGVPQNFTTSARLGQGRYFVLEADEYDTAFFDKRAKFVHYRPDTLVITNLEYDHADIYPDLLSIQRQFHHMIRIMPQYARIIHSHDARIQQVLAMGCWTQQETTALEYGDWYIKGTTVFYKDVPQGTLELTLLGDHNKLNALQAIAAVNHVGFSPSAAVKALAGFKGVKRRQERLVTTPDICVYNDFAHHPTAIQATLQALQAGHPKSRLIVVLDLGSQTMRLGQYNHILPKALQKADVVYLAHQRPLSWSMTEFWSHLQKPGGGYTDMSALVSALQTDFKPGDTVVLMSNTGFQGLPSLIEEAFSPQAAVTTD